ncbi:MAG: hypothetical protein M3Z17_01635 [Gemmatimonadota bacterium]|nr:hypothetical protein [Gemmatimonadota bacterium]
MKSLTSAAAVVAVTLAGCAPLPGGRFSATVPVAADATSELIAPPIVQVREYWRSSAVSIVAWDKDDAEFGLRTAVTRTGTLVGGQRFGDHRLYLAPFLARDMGGFKYATVAKGELLVRTGIQKDTYACYYGNVCSPMIADGVRIPDSLLRANRDSLVVTFFPNVQPPWTLTLRRELIAAYLQKVDSIAAVMGRVAAM